MAKIKEKQLQYALYGLIVLGILITIYAISTTGAFSNMLGKPAATAQPASLKPKISLTIITVPNCRPCANLTGFASSIKQAGDVDITAIKNIAYQNATDLISKYGIKKLPTVLISGETDKVANLTSQWASVGDVKADGTLVLTRVPPVYFDLDKGKFVGLLKVVRIVNSTCYDCYDENVLQGNLEAGAGITFAEEQALELNDTRAKALIAQYNITKIPTFVITGEVDAYSGLKQKWLNVGSVEDDGALVWRMTPPPYQELPSGKTRGLAAMLAIQDENCKECYDPSVHERILGAYGVVISNTTYLNYTQPWAKKLIQKYNITFVPTVLIDSQMDEYYPYTQLEQVWKQAGSTEADGWHVFRNMTALGANLTFYNLTSGKIETTK